VARRLALAVLLPLALLALWATAVQQRWVVEGIVPSPAQVARSWYQWIVGGPTRSLSPYSGTWLANVAYSGRRVLEGFVLAAVELDQCADIGKVKGPILRGLAARPPYFHNGSAATLSDVVEFYDQRFGIGFTAAQKADLVAFLNAL